MNTATADNKTEILADAMEEPCCSKHNEVEDKSSEASLKDKASKSIRDANSRITEGAANIKEAASQSLHEAQDVVKTNYSKASEVAKDSYSGTKATVKTNFEKHPLMFLAGAVATGVAIGMSLPNTRREKELLKKPADTLRNGANEAKSKLTDAAEAAKDAAMGSLEENNLDPESLKETAGEIANKSAHSAAEAVKS